MIPWHSTDPGPAVGIAFLFSMFDLALGHGGGGDLYLCILHALNPASQIAARECRKVCRDETFLWKETSPWGAGELSSTA